MTPEQKPEALRLADEMESDREYLETPRSSIAAELRRLHAEVESLRAQIGQGEPSQAASDAYDRIDHFLRQKLDDHDYTHYSFDLDLVWGAASAPQQIGQGVPTDEQIMATVQQKGFGFSQSRPLAQQWDQVCELIRAVVRERNTHPAPQQKPLTDEQIDAVYREFMLYQDGLTPSGMKRVARAVERAHGIGEKK